MADALELRLDLGGLDHVAVRQMAEVELHARLQAPFQRNLVDGKRPFPAVHGRVVVPRRVNVGAVVGGDLEHLDRPTLAIRQIGRLEAREE